MDKNKLIYVGVVVAAFAGGWFAKPERVREVEKLSEIDYTKLAEVAKSMTEVRYVQIKDTTVNESWRKQELETVWPDGKVDRSKTEEKNVSQVINEKTTETRVQIVEVEKQVVVYKDVVKEVTKEPVQKDWHVALSAGVTSNNILPVPENLQFGLSADRRIVGDIWLGAYGMSNTKFDVSAGLRVAVQF